MSGTAGVTINRSLFHSFRKICSLIFGGTCGQKWRKAGNAVSPQAFSYQGYSRGGAS
jgi:hypothetical protein